ncbi:conserved hypothetical protein [Neospora caninum Liverpool]|uniref:Uncharacterized protein n=1 Tax=Neospora caninum (strain Liverpool) TaxID=572307 RepID=F0VLS1_NEOCL|nr:conserved hypothetical protein [Neospora caninum Liverpool]CBZ54199.1 conserved hypothetical protein [Neospora caninum Liverpool]CEL68899.1 TPA: hypothetical protein BN1204_046320 [Neospora caninum Liverpool]|eukprot:XP_003884230.1 conserved hypothetical protein [Neospora caninum Liverpool]
MATLATSSSGRQPPSSRLPTDYEEESVAPASTREAYCGKEGFPIPVSPSTCGENGRTAPLAGWPGSLASAYGRRVEKTESVASLLGGCSGYPASRTTDGREGETWRSKRLNHADAEVSSPSNRLLSGRHDAAGAGGSRYTGRECQEAGLADDPSACASLYRRRQQAHHNLFGEDEGETPVTSITGNVRGKGRFEPCEEQRGEKFERRARQDMERSSVLSKTTSTTEAWSSGNGNSLDCHKTEVHSDESRAPAGVSSDGPRRDAEGLRDSEEEGKRLEDASRTLDEKRQWRAHQGGDDGYAQSVCSRVTASGGSSPARRPDVASPGVRTLQGNTPAARLGTGATPSRLVPPPLSLPDYCDTDTASRGSYSPSAFPQFPAPAGIPPGSGRDEASERARSCTTCSVCDELRRGSPVSPSAYSCAPSVASHMSPFSPKRDERNTRVKQIEALRSTGNVLPVSEATSAAVKAAAIASLRGTSRQALWGEEPEEILERGRGRSKNEELPYPLNQMTRRRMHDGPGTGDEFRPSQQPTPRLFPQGIPWHSSAASVLSSRASHSQSHPLSGAPSSPFAGEGPSVSREMTARERSLAQFHGTGEIFGRDSRPDRSGLSSPSSVHTTDAAQIAREETERRRELQRENPWYSDMFNRETPVSSRVATTQGAWGDAESVSGASRVGISKGDTLDRQTSDRRRTQLLESKTAYERFVNAMQSDVFPSGDPSAAAQRHLERAERARTSLLKEKHQDQERRQRLLEAVETGGGRMFHSVTGEETNLPGAGCEKVHREAAQLPSKVVELDLFGIREDMTEERIREICAAGAKPSPSRGSFRISALPLGEQTHFEEARDRRQESDTSPRLNCVMKVTLARDLLTSQCKGTGKVTLRCREGQDEEEVLRRLYAANIGVRVKQVTVDRPPQLPAKSFAHRR